MRSSSISLGSSFILITLWTYTISSKLFEFRYFKIQMRKQVFPEDVAEALIYILPMTEFLVVGLLCFALTRLCGFLFSIFLLLAFSIYIALILTDIFGKVPCSCGGILEQLGWGEHLIFNLVFIAVALTGLFAELNHLKERRD